MNSALSVFSLSYLTYRGFFSFLSSSHVSATDLRRKEIFYCLPKEKWFFLEPFLGGSKNISGAGSVTHCFKAKWSSSAKQNTKEGDGSGASDGLKVPHPVCSTMSLTTFRLTTVKCHKKLEATEEPLPSIVCCAAATFKSGLVLNILSNRACLERAVSITEAYVSSELELSPGHSSGSCSCAQKSWL